MARLYVRYLLPSVLALLSLTVVAQDVILIGQNDQISSCNGNFFDAGGESGGHGGAGAVQTTTICSDGSSGESVRVFFSEIEIDGVLNIYNGNTTGAPLLGSLTGTNDDSSVAFRSTAGNASGCLTFEFTSGGTSLNGWKASVICVNPCQPISAVILGTTPPRLPDTDEGFIDVCPGDPITLRAEGRYPEDGQEYAQSDATSEFTWTFQDGTSATGPTVTHIYEEPGAYQINLTIEDERGCRNALRTTRRVRVAPAPVFNEPSNLPANIYPGDEIIIDVGGTDPNSLNISPTPQRFSFRTSQTFSELTPLPDDITTYQSSLEFSSFANGQRLERGDQIVSICASMEHSFLGDLGISVECPDGTKLDLHRYSSDIVGRVGNQTLGLGDKFTITPDPPGTYCWTANAPATMREVVQRGSFDAGEKIPEIDYRAEGGSFDEFIGCELNGNWSFNVLDSLPDDNGTVYSWTIEFASDVFPNLEEFTVPLSSVTIEDNNLYDAYTPTRAALNTNNPGPKKVRIVTEDDFSCRFDTTLTLLVESPFARDCSDRAARPAIPGIDTSVCQGDDITVDFSTAVAEDTVIIWESIAFDEVSNSLYPSETEAYGSTIRVTDHNPATVRDVARDIESVCINLENIDQLSELTVQLLSPDGTTLRLLESISANNARLSNTCFAPTATQAIGGGSSPFSGTFIPVNNNWAALNGEAINGDWTLQIWDAAGNDVSRLASWSIALRYDREVTYSWSPSDGTLSCTDCPTPTIAPATATIYVLSISTADGCSQTVEVDVDFSALQLDFGSSVAPPTCNGGNDGSISVTIASNPGNLTLSWSDQPSNSSLIRTGLSAGTYALTATDEDGCSNQFIIELSAPPPITFTSSENRVTCFGRSDGGLTITDITGPNPGNYVITWGPEAENSDQSTVRNLPAGDYPLTVTDVQGCAVDTFVTLTQPQPLLSSIAGVNVSCFGEADARLTASGTGGTPAYAYRWSTGSTDPVLSDLIAGNYFLTLTDENNCTDLDTFNVTQPDTLVLDVMTDSVLCLGGFSGAAVLVASGGNQPFTYRLGERGAGRNSIFLGLAAGEYPVFVTDANGCADDALAVVDDGLFFGVSVGPDSTIVFGDSLTLSATLIGGRPGVQYAWRPSAPTSISCRDCADPVVQPEFETDFTLVATDGNGCTAEDRIRIRVRKIREVAVPTGFTPNGDLRNDVLLVHGRPGTRVVSMQVYDRWATLIYEGADFMVNDPEAGWDGDGHNAGVYFYKLVVEYDDRSQETLSGQTTLIR